MPMFDTVKPFELSEDGEHYGSKGKYSNFVSDLVDVQFQIGGVYCYIYRLQGTFDQDRDELGVLVDENGSKEGPTDIDSFLGIQDPILIENRDRAYDFEEIPRIKGVYQISSSEIEMMRYGFKSNETISMEFSQRIIEKELGRRFIQGDVIELPHLREVGLDGRVANRWYEVKDISWSPGGYDMSYQKHVVAVILQPIRHQQEFLDLFENVRDEYGKTLEEQTSVKDQLMGITEAVQQKAGEHASTTWWDTTIMWFNPDDPNAKPWRYTDDGKPPNGEPVDQGEEFPPKPKNGDWFVRTDLVPNRLYRFSNNRWSLRETDVKRQWQPYNWVIQQQDFFVQPEDKSYELRSVHDTITSREHRSDPTGSKST